MRTLQSELKNKGFADKETSEKKKPVKKASANRREKLSDKDLRELMGEFRPTFSRKKGGAFRQR